MPERRTISIHCMGCRTLLYKYRKGGTGALVKCFVDRIAEDRTRGDLRCPSCGQEFARNRTISGKPVCWEIARMTTFRLSSPTNFSP